MKFTILYVLTAGACILMVNVALGQTDPSGVEREAMLTIVPVYQTWSLGDDRTMSEFTTVFSYYQPIGQSTGLTLRAAPASTSGDPQSMSGFTDSQVRLTHTFSGARLVLSLGLNLPTGKKELTDDEFATSMILSSQAFSWRAPGFGQGFNVQPGVVWAVPAGEDVVLGVGATYHRKGSFSAIKAYDDFDPGDEFSMTAGADFRLAEATNLSFDMLLTFYGADKLGSEVVFRSGNKAVLSGHFAKALGRDELSLLARYRSKGKGEVGFAGVLTAENQATEPDQFELHGQYALFLGSRLTLTFGLQGKFHSETPAEFSGAQMFGIFAATEISLSRSITAAPRLHYQTGSLKGERSVDGFEAGMSLRVGL